MKADTINNEYDIERGENGAKEESKATEATTLNVNESGCCAVASVCFCLIIAIVCICVSLEHNEASENEIIKMEGTPVIVFGIGVIIIGCLLFCMAAAACARCCDICLIFIH